MIFRDELLLCSNRTGGDLNREYSLATIRVSPAAKVDSRAGHHPNLGDARVSLRLWFRHLGGHRADDRAVGAVARRGGGVGADRRGGEVVA
ncbi:protein of unknown function [Burkholderia multivorans]